MAAHADGAPNNDPASRGDRQPGMRLRAHLIARSFSCALLLLTGLPLLSAAVHAHGIVGDRFFPATMATDDPFSADELALPTFERSRRSDDGSTVGETDYDFEYSKSIVPGFAVSLGGGYARLTQAGEPVRSGFRDFSIAPALELLRSPEHEFIASASVEWEIGGSGSTALAEPASTYTPSLRVGKGFGDLPENLALLRPFALTASIGYANPAEHAAARSIEWSGALEYSLLYLKNNVRDAGIGNIAAHLTPIVEFAFSSPVGAGRGPTTGTINPGLLWSGQFVQFGIEAAIPVNKVSASKPGVIAQLHFHIDDLFPHSLGMPLFGGT
jgi:hypothetical protein